MKFLLKLERMIKLSSTRMLGIHSWKAGQLTSIGPGDEPLLCDEGWMVFLDPNCNTVCVCYPNIIREKVIAGS